MTRNTLGLCLPSGLATIALLLVLAVRSAGQEPLRDAAYLWHMADTSNAIGAEGNLRPQGNVSLGEPLKGSERTASLARGGDGKVAHLEDGYLALAKDEELEVNPRQWTLAIRMRDPQGTWRCPILGNYGSEKEVSFALRAVDGTKKPFADRNLGGGEVPTIYSWMFKPGGPRSVCGSSSLLEFVWGAEQSNAARVERIRRMQPERTWPNPLEQDVVNALMKPCFPVALIGPTDWHDIVVTLTGPKLELWIDGVLVDEEYPIGVTRQRTLPFLIGAEHENGDLRTGLRGLIDHVAIWNRGLSKAEIIALSGGADRVRKRELAILGDESPTMQYFRPRGHNRKAGDLIPYWDAQTKTFRLFYLILRRNMHSKWDGGHGGLEIWQASTRDLRAWEHHPVTVPITEQWEAWNGTGAVAFHNGRYHWFYPTPDYDGDHGGIQLALSEDGVHFTKTESHPFMEGGDCEVLQDDDGLFHMIKAGPTQRADTKPLTDKTLVAWVQVDDLDQGGGSVLTVEHADGQQFDAIVLGERLRKRWMPGSDRFQRTPHQQNDWPEETATPDAVIQMALVFEAKHAALYRNGVLYTEYDIAEPVTFPSGSSLLIGLRHTHATRQTGFFRGRILDARVYDKALSPNQLVALKPDSEGGPDPLAWYDFENGSLQDKTGNFPEGLLYGEAKIEDGTLILNHGDYFKTPGTLHTQVRLTSKDLQNWTEVDGPFIASDKHLAICPNVFQFGPWHYYICGSGVWRSRGPYGPWTEHEPQRLDNLAVPKTAAFGENRRIYAGFLTDGGWGGNSVLRELVQDDEGRLGTRFVPELIPACTDVLPLRFEPTAETAKTDSSVRLEAKNETKVVSIPEIEGDYRLQLEIVPDSDVKTVGIGLRAGPAPAEEGCDLIFQPAQKRVRFSKMSNSGGGIGGGPGLESVNSLDNPFHVDIIVRHDILDAEIAGFRSITTRFWNPDGNQIRLFVENGAVTFRNIRIRRLAESYAPYSVHRDKAFLREGQIDK